MDFAIHEFIEFLNQDTNSDYGDFKREADYQLKLLQQKLRPLSTEQGLHLQRMREQLLWSYKDNIGEMRSWLKEEARSLGEYGGELEL